MIRLIFQNFVSTFVIIKLTNMNTRLKQFLAAENISQSQFADTIKVVRASVSHVLSGRNKPGYDFITAIMSAYPHLSIEWLMLGKGKMYRNIKETKEQPALQSPDEDQPLLFHYEEDLPEACDSPQPTYQNASPAPDVTAASRNSIETSVNFSQNAVKQRKATKILIFFDDDTFQEIAANSL